MKAPIIHDWHRPRNEACSQNKNPAKDCDCAKPKRNFKPYRVVRVHDTEVNHGVKPDIIIEVHPNGRLIFREKGRPRRFSYGTTAADIYGRLVRNEALRKMAAKKKERAARRAERNAARKAAR